MKQSIKNGISFLFFLLAFNFLYGQNFEDVVYLKNGSIIRGIIIEQVPNQNIKIQTKDRNVFVFKYNEIEKMTKENLPTDNSYNSPNVTDFKRSGFINLTEINYSDGVGNVKIEDFKFKNNDNSFGFRTVNGYQFNKHFSLGIGIGIDKYKNTTFLPITFDGRATILKGKISPIFTANIGYAFGLNDSKGGVTFNPQIGIKTYLSKNIAYIFNFGYKLQAQIWDIPITDNVGQSLGTLKSKLYYNFISFSTGFSF
jgi:hypothetical protein